jgi:hypothetical protein
MPDVKPNWYDQLHASMTLRTHYSVVCSCGHKGNIKFSENDAPFSANWESYSLENLEGSIGATSSADTWEDFFRKSRIVCPACKSVSTAANIQS